MRKNPTSSGSQALSSTHTHSHTYRGISVSTGVSTCATVIGFVRLEPKSFIPSRRVRALSHGSKMNEDWEDKAHPMSKHIHCLMEAASPQLHYPDGSPAGSKAWWRYRVFSNPILPSLSRQSTNLM